jgi:hypothetical protein
MLRRDAANERLQEINPAALWDEASEMGCRLLAQNGHGVMSDLSPLSGVERKTSAPDEYFAF